ncbi:MAG: aminotransferase class I/II-fold pyridoxal phosphate-dependent enzyme, partial [Pseudomonadota bacterium]
SNPQVLRFRTFSKAYGLAGARVGYVLGHEEVISAFDKVRNHYGMNRTGQIGALAALTDQAFIDDIRGRFEKGRQRIAEIAAENGLEALNSVTNFVAIDCKQDSAFAKSVMNGLLEKGVFVRMPGVEPQSRCIRISVGLDEELDIFARELPDVLRKLR